MVDRNDKRFFDFMCSCGEERMQKCDKVYDDVKSELESSDVDFITHIVHGLNNLDNGMANIEHIYTDMWSGIAVNYQYNYKEDVNEWCKCEEGKDEDECECSPWTIQKFWIECDRIHHGLARGYQLVKEFDESLKK